jgi:hypothetical protein
VSNEHRTEFADRYWPFNPGEELADTNREAKQERGTLGGALRPGDQYKPADSGPIQDDTSQNNRAPKANAAYCLDAPEYRDEHDRERRKVNDRKDDIFSIELTLKREKDRCHCERPCPKTEYDGQRQDEPVSRRLKTKKVCWKYA